MTRAIAAIGAVALTLVLAPAGSGRTTLAGTTFLDNGKIRVGVDLDDGGKIAFLAPASGARSEANLVFQSEQSYYRGEPGQPPLWHANADYATVLQGSNDGGRIYTKSVPQPACRCTLEQWVTIGGSAVHVHNVLTAFLSDVKQYTASWQELPALYTLGSAHRLVTYDRNAPYTHGDLTEYTRADGGVIFSTPGPAFDATEHWAALVDDDDFGVGLFEPQRTLFAGIAGLPDAQPWQINGYLTASAAEILDANVTYAYDYTLVLGTVGAIRSYAYAHRPDSRPDYRFTTDRQSWWYRNATDRGFPISDSLRVSVDQDDPQLVGPDSWWRARSVPRIYVRGRWRTSQNMAGVFWRIPGLQESGQRRRVFRVGNDGLFHTYRVDLYRTPTYRGPITGLRLDPVFGAESGGLVDITCISWKPCPIDRTAEKRLIGNDGVPYLDDFSRGVDGSVWWVGRSGIGPTVDAVDGRLELGMPADARPDPGQTWISANLQTRCRILGDFDVQVDYQLLEWPSSNGVHVDLDVADDRAMVRLNTGGEAVVAWFPPWVASAPDDELSGSFRIRRRGSSIYGYALSARGWYEVSRGRFVGESAFVRLQIGANVNEFSKQRVRVAFDDMRISSGRLACPS
jgi:hypothetical protein